MFLILICLITIITVIITENNNKSDGNKNSSKKENINIAIGQVWKDKFDCGLDELLQESETKMYIDKDKYYKEHKVERRK